MHATAFGDFGLAQRSRRTLPLGAKRWGCFVQGQPRANSQAGPLWPQRRRIQPDGATAPLLPDGDGRPEAETSCTCTLPFSRATHRPRSCSCPWPGSASCRLAAQIARGLVVGLAPTTLPATRVAAVSRWITHLGGAALAGAKSALVAELGAQGAGRVRRLTGQLTSFFLTDCSMPLSSRAPHSSPADRLSRALGRNLRLCDRN